MIYMLMADGVTSEFSEAAHAVVEGDQVVLRCREGSLVHEARLVTAYGSKEAHFKDYSRPATTDN